VGALAEKTRTREETLRRAHSLSGVVPLGVFLLLHVLVNASALGSEQRFTASARAFQAIPAITILEVLFVIAPLAFHAIYGVKLARDGSLRSPYPPIWRKWLHGTGYGAFAFVLLHLWQTSARKWFYGESPLAFHTTLEASLSSTVWGIPLVAIVYLAGIGCTCLHFAAGLWGFSVTWNLSRSDRAKRRGAWTAGAVGALLFLLGALSVVRYATGSNILTATEPLPDGPPRPACSAP